MTLGGELLPQNSELKMIRYTMFYDAMADCYCELEEAEDGDYVLYEDYAKLDVELKKLKGELKIKSEFLSSRQCPDHNGKWERGRCLQCELEQRAKELEEKVRELEDEIESIYQDAAGASL